MLQSLLTFRKSDRPWHLPVLAGLCVGIPILIGYFSHHLQEGKLASLAGLVILYIHSQDLAKRMITLMTCCFGIMFSFTIGAVFSYHPLIAPLALGLFAFAVHIILYQLGMVHPPGNFFFIMTASVAICMPFELESIPKNIGYVGIGTMISCLLGFIYSLVTLRKGITAPPQVVIRKDREVNLIEATVIGIFAGLALLIANLMKLDNPYWVPTSCVAVMQGASTSHVVSKGLQRVLGTFVGLGLTWLLLLLRPPELLICLAIMFLQMIVEFLVVRNYAIAVIFITVMTMFLAESTMALTGDTNRLLTTRFFDILVGSALGALGGWVLHNQEIHVYAKRQMRRTRIMMRNNSKKDLP